MDPKAMENKSFGYSYAVSIKSSVSLLCGMEGTGSVGIAAGLQLDSGNMLRLMAEARDVSSSNGPG